MFDTYGWRDQRLPIALAFMIIAAHLDLRADFVRQASPPCSC